MIDIPVFTRGVETHELVRAALFGAGGAVAGFVVYRLLLSRLRGLASITSWGGDRIVLAALRDAAMLSFTVAGTYVAVRTLPFDADIARTFDRVLFAAAVVATTLITARTVSAVIKLFSMRSASVGRGSSIFLNVARIAVGAVGLLVLLQTLGVRIAPLLAALGVGGLAIALALQEPMKNFFAGLQLLATRKVRPGHYVKLDTGDEGYITDVDWRHTSMRQLPDNMVIVPNAALADAVITNYDYPRREMSLVVDVGVHHDSDLDHVEKVTVDVASGVMRDVEGAVRDWEPFVRFHTFADSSIDFSVILRISHVTDQHLVRHEFLKRLKRRYAEEEIRIPFPTVAIEPPQRSWNTASAGSM